MYKRQALHEDIKEPVALYSFTKDENIESLGLSVFKDYKMVGRLSGLETICYNIITNNFDEATIEVYNPQDSVHPLSVNLSHFKDTQLSVKPVSFTHLDVYKRQVLVRALLYFL